MVINKILESDKTVILLTQDGEQHTDCGGSRDGVRGHLPGDREKWGEVQKLAVEDGWRSFLRRPLCCCLSPVRLELHSKFEATLQETLYLYTSQI